MLKVNIEKFVSTAIIFIIDLLFVFLVMLCIPKSTSLFFLQILGYAYGSFPLLVLLPVVFSVGLIV